MDPRAKRILIPAIIAAMALGLVALIALRPDPNAPSADSTTPVLDAAAAADGDAATADPLATPTPVLDDADEADGTEPATDGDDTAAPSAPSDAEGGRFAGLRAQPVVDGATPSGAAPQSLGSLDPELAPFEVRFARNGAGIAEIVCADLWERARDKRQAEAHRAEVAEGGTVETEMPPDAARYHILGTEVLTRPLPDRTTVQFEVPAFAANRIVINGVGVALIDASAAPGETPAPHWAELEPGVFACDIVNGAGEPIATLTRRYVLGADFDLELRNEIANHTDEALTIQWTQWGPGDLRADRARYMDRRRLRFGYVTGTATDATVEADTDQLYERQSVFKDFPLVIWPNETSVEDNQALSWFASTNRYFAVVVHPLLAEDGAGDRRLTDLVETIYHEKPLRPDAPEDKAEHRTLFTTLESPARTVEANGTLDLDFGIFAGPLDREILKEQQPYIALQMGDLILYQMSSFCAFCTFQPVAKLLLAFLDLLHNYVVFDWAIAIIILVLVVRTLLHPITKRSQVNMQKFGKAMQAMKPELEKLQEKYKDDPKRMQQEQLRLWQQYGVSPLHMLGCLPMFLQTPIWIALYAMLYFAFDIRQEAAFYGLFQKLTGGSWAFLGDLSSADHCLGAFDEPVQFLLWNVTGINVLPILMGVIFFIQQKYMAPPPSPTMTADQMRTQKMMKVMMVVMFPLMLYSAPSGLTLYIMTSSIVGILESRYIRAHVDALEIQPKRRTNVNVAAPSTAGREVNRLTERMKAAEERREQKRNSAKPKSRRKK